MTGLLARTFYRLAAGYAIPVTLGLRNIYILPTGHGLLFLTVLGAMLVGSINYNNNLGFLLTFLLGSLGLTAMMHTYSMLHGLSLVSATAMPVFAGEPVMVEITTTAADRQQTGLRWYFSAGDHVVAKVNSGHSVRVMVPVPTTHRGSFNPGWLRISSEYPLGLFRAWARINTDLQCLVYPRPVRAPASVLRTLSTHGDGGIARPVGADDFMGLIAYQPGDPPGRIHWQAYSRGRGLHVKTFGGQAGADLMLDLNDLNGNDVERNLSILCYHLLQAHRQRCRVGMKLAAQTIPAGRGRVHRDRCLKALALYGKY